MDKANRAAQFLPFDALNGLQEELRKREEIHSRIEKKELNEEKTNLISSTLFRLEKDNVVEVTFFYFGHYVTVTDKVENKNAAYGFLTINGNKIYFDDIYDIKIVADNG